jgi:chorismate mutase/prephenate dehydratase
MNLDEIRLEIDAIDDEILKLFSKRMECVRYVADYKKKNNLPILHQNREQDILTRLSNNCPEKLKSSVNILFKTIMDISKASQEQDIANGSEIAKTIANSKPFSKKSRLKIGCQGIEGAYSHIASLEIYPDAEFIFFNTFEDVFSAVDNQTVDFGVLPQQNSTAGSVNSVYSLLSSYNLYINQSYDLKINHCLATRFDVNADEIEEIISHEMALSQCSKFIQDKNISTTNFANTAVSAKFVANSDKNIASICSKKSAEIYGLKILFEDIQNKEDNYTKFISISKKVYLNPSADTVTISLLLPHIAGSLYRLLTKFAVCGVNLTKIESSPIGNKNFDVVFYINFEGNISSPNVVSLINDLSNEMCEFKFLGNFKN